MKINLQILLLCTCLGVSACTSMPDMRTAKKAVAEDDYKTAVSHYEALSEFGIPEAKVELAKLYIDGKGIPQDSLKALSLLNEAQAEGKSPQTVRYITQTQIKLGADTLKGENTGLSKPEALKLLDSAAQKNDPRALFELGYAYEKGNGVSADGARSAQYYERAAVKEYPRAYAQLGRLYAKGLGVPQDTQKAEEYFIMAQKEGIKVDSDLVRLRQKSR